MKIELQLLDENLEVAGRRFVADTECVVARQEPDSICAYKLMSSEGLPHIDEAQVGWFVKGENPKREAVTRNMHYLSVTLSLPEAPYDESWDKFRKQGVHKLLRALDMTTYVFGRGVIEQRDEDIFIVELSGFDHPMWGLYVTVHSGWTYADCMEVVRQIEHCAATHLIPLLTA